MAKVTIAELLKQLEQKNELIDLLQQNANKLNKEIDTILSDKGVVKKIEFEGVIKDLERIQTNYKIKSDYFDKAKVYINELKELNSTLINKNTILETELQQFKNNDSILINNNTIEKKHNERGAGRKSNLTQEQLENVKDLHSKGLSYSKIGEAVGISKAYVFKLINKQV